MGKEYDIEANDINTYPTGGDFDANTLVVDFMDEDNNVVATFLKPISIIDSSIFEKYKKE
jgi:hypothetical protein